ncbi:hypothetical protein ANAPRD1_01334 [Anaplasma phagocytophilum]|nr:hypothetical protein ANAPRD1_01334 [Anaplasma phagocytophilum]
MQFANAVKVSAPNIDKQVCNKNHAKDQGDSGHSPTGFQATQANTKTAQCSGLDAPSTSLKFSDFAEGVGLRDNKNWPTGQYYKSGGSNTYPGVQNSNAKAVAKDLVQELNRDEKTIVAGLLAKTIEGGEVVEICLSTST